MANTVITDKAMQARPAATDIWLIESRARGAGQLVGRITPAGKRAFYFRYTASDGQRVRYPIGPYEPRGDGSSALTVQQARDRARDLSALYRSGFVDIREHIANLTEDRERAVEDDRRRAAEKSALDLLERERRLSVRQLFERWQAVDLAPRVGTDGKRKGRKDGGSYTLQQFERYIFPRFGDVACGEMGKRDLMDVLDAVKAAGKLRTCNVLLSDLKQMFSFALVREIIDRNPLELVTRGHAGGKETLRERVLSIDEIAALPGLLSKARINPRTEAAIWLILATGARVGEVMGAVWKDEGLNLDDLAELPEAAEVKLGAVDTVNRRWYLPTTKNEREHTIHLSDFALRQIAKIEALRESRIDDSGEEVNVPWLFPNSAATGPVNVKSFGKQLADRQMPPERRLKGRSKQTDSLRLPGGRWTAHDLRRTAGTLMASIGISGDVIDECLNHVIESRVRRTNIRDRRPLEQANAFDALGSRLAQIAAAKSPVERAGGAHCS